MIPRGALVLGLAGLLPFLWAALGILVPAVSDFTVSLLGPRFNAPYMLVSYGTVILCFMSGVLWGFATKTNEVKAFALSVMPALWAFFMIGDGPVTASLNLSIGFAGLLILDWQFQKWGLAPPWWMKLRVLLTVLVLLSLAPVAFG